MENSIYKWNFNDNKNRGKTWYVIVISIVIGLTIWGILTKQYGLSFVIILITGVTFFIENNSPDIIEIEINNLGIKISESFYDFSKIESYSFIYDNENAIFLKLWLKKKGIKSFNLKINNKICSELKNILPEYLEEEKKLELTTLEKFIHFLKL